MKRRRLGLLLALLFLSGAFGVWRWYEWRERSQDKVILAATHHYDVEPALVKAIVWRESRFNPRARGRAGEIGLMQIREAAAMDWAMAERITSFSHEQLASPLTNTLVGAWYLKKLLKRYQRTDNPMPYALADYNAGRSNVLRWSKDAAATNSVAFIEQIGFPGTREYVQSILRRYEYYRPSFKPAQ